MIEPSRGWWLGTTDAPVSQSWTRAALSNFAAQVVRFVDGLVVEGWFLDENPYELDELYGQSS
jgi:hypothetical protein